MKVLCSVILVGLIFIGTAEGNIFKDKILQQIYTLQNSRDVNGLTVYLKDKNPQYRKAAAMAFASVQAPAAIESLSLLLSDESEPVRSASAYALGQTLDKKAEPILIQAFQNEKSLPVKRVILEAIGKCGTETGLEFLTKLETGNQPDLLTGQAYGLYRFALHNVFSPAGTYTVFEILKQMPVENARFIAGHYLGRLQGADLSSYSKQFIESYHKNKALFIRLPIVLGMGKCPKPEILDLLKSIVNSNEDYRLRVNAARSIGNFPYAEVKDILIRLLSDNNSHVAFAASEAILAKGNEKDAAQYFEVGKNLGHWRARSTTLSAAVKYSKNDADKEKYSSYIKGAEGNTGLYAKTPNVFEKALLLAVLAGDYRNYPFIEAEAFSNIGKTPVLCTYGIDALLTICHDEKVKSDESLMKTFFSIFKKAVESSDEIMVLNGAAILREPELNFKRFIQNPDFLIAAMERYQSSGNWELKDELRKTISFFKGEPIGENTPHQNAPIDWALVTSIPSAQRVKLVTDRGDIVIQLMVDEAPGSTSNFVKLARENFFKASTFHRVVPNFVIQDGCPRGDGNAGPSYTIGSEFGGSVYGEGYVGMASGGKDTEGSQWFITHSPTPHLDGRYTIFGKVIAGMTVVHQIQIGDRIKKIIIL